MTSEAMTSVPSHVPAARVIDFDVYHPTGIEDGYHAAWQRLQAPVGSEVSA